MNQLQNSLPKIVNALTIDVEDYFQVSAFAPHISRENGILYHVG